MARHTVDPTVLGSHLPYYRGLDGTLSLDAATVRDQTTGRMSAFSIRIQQDGGGRFVTLDDATEETPLGAEVDALRNRP